MTLVNDTIAYNVGSFCGGVYETNPPTSVLPSMPATTVTAQVSIWKTIIARNMTALTGGTEADLLDSFISLGHNLIGTDVGSTGFTESAVHIVKVGGSSVGLHIAGSNGDIVGGATKGPLSAYEVGLSTVLAVNQAASHSAPLTLTLALTSTSLANGNGDSSPALLAYLDQPVTVNGVTEELPVDQRGYVRSTNLLPTGTTRSASGRTRLRWMAIWADN